MKVCIMNERYILCYNYKNKWNKGGKINLSQIICERRKYEESNNIHTHKYGQLILPISGNLNIETTHKKLNIDNNKIFLLPPDCEHLFNAKKNNEFLVLDIPTNFLKKSHMSGITGGQEVLFDDKWKAVRYLFLEEINKKIAPHP